MSTYRILIVEDEVLIGVLLSRYLQRQGHEVVGSAISYEEATKLYRAKQPDLVLLDIQLSGKKTGIDLANFIRKQRHVAPYIFLTSQLDRKNITDAKATFPAGYLPKPIHKEALFTTIEIAIHNHIAPRQQQQPEIMLEDGSKKRTVALADIALLRADHVYVRVYLTNGRELLQRKSLSRILEQVPTQDFLQVHRSYVVNVKQISRWDNENIYIQGQIIPISRTKRKMVNGRLTSRSAS